MMATYDVVLSALYKYRVSGVVAGSAREAERIAMDMWWGGRVNRKRPFRTYLEEAIARKCDEGGDDEGDQETDSALGADSLNPE